MDQVDGEKKTLRKSRTVHTKFSIPLCCFGTGSQLDAEFNLTTNETAVESDNDSSETQQTQCAAKPTTSTSAPAATVAVNTEIAVTNNVTTTTQTSDPTELGGSV